VDKKGGSLAPGSCRMSAVRFGHFFLKTFQPPFMVTFGTGMQLSRGHGHVCDIFEA